MAEEKQTSWGDEVSKVIESLGRGLGSVIGRPTAPTGPTTPIVVTPPTTKPKSGLLVVGLIAVVAIGGAVFYFAKKNK